ncbi:hypothetical protein HN937_30540 [Candidatus Poribacteria bacterium]|nr:hypothetical protein [Candidatus Poribacteria bacterium]
MSSTETRYSARFQMPDLLEQGRDNATQCPAYLDGALAEPSSGTVTVFNAAGTEVVSAAAVVVSGSIATYTVLAAALAAENLEEGWVVEWALVMPDLVTHTFRNSAACVRRRLYPSITDLDLFRRESSLNPAGNDPVTTLADYQDFIDEADVDVQQRLIQKGNRPNLITDPSTLRPVWLYLTLSLVFEDMATRQNETWAAKAAHYRDMYEREFSRLSVLYDGDDDGMPDSATNRRSLAGSVWLCGRSSR